MKKLLLLGLLIASVASKAQTITDGLMMQHKDLCTGLIFTTDQWKQYWEGSLKRENGNIGSVRTQSLTWVGAYGLSPEINLIAMVPYVRTKASAGTLQAMEGLQDLTVAVKYNFFKKESTESTFKTFAGLAVSTPLTDYTQDFFPLSIGTHTTNISWRATAFYKFLDKFYVNGSGAYTWRSNTTLDRSAYYTEGHLYRTNEVKMPNTIDYTFSIGYLNNGLQADLTYTQQNTLGGSDIRRQDMPFVSNKMNFSKVGILAMYYLKKPAGLAIRGGAMQTIAGRNVGESTTFMAGILYTLHLGIETNADNR